MFFPLCGDIERCITARLSDSDALRVRSLSRAHKALVESYRDRWLQRCGRLGVNSFKYVRLGRPRTPFEGIHTALGSSHRYGWSFPAA